MRRRMKWTMGMAWLALAAVVAVVGVAGYATKYAWDRMNAKPGGNPVTGTGQPAGTTTPTSPVGSSSSSSDWLKAFGAAALEFATPGADGRGLSANLKALFGNLSPADA